MDHQAHPSVLLTVYFHIATMHFSASFLSAIAAVCQFAVIPALGATAAPAANDQITLFADANFQGVSEEFDNPTSCTEVPQHLEDDVSSLIVGSHIGCTLYSFHGCIAASALGTYNGLGDRGVGAYPSLGADDDKATSFRCSHLG
ncbi:hypothetical protein BD779DRAFT_1529915 [Infundibulicybe gibba]|nr:hypothetical protein BD779DRAFT_1529915 [Infundibulicybe gibba]